MSYKKVNTGKLLLDLLHKIHGHDPGTLFHMKIQLTFWTEFRKSAFCFIYLFFFNFASVIYMTATRAFFLISHTTNFYLVWKYL